MMNRQQLEINLSSSPFGRRGAARQVRPARAQWWFERMHRVVDAAVEWRPEPAARCRQAPLPFAPEREREAA